MKKTFLFMFFAIFGLIANSNAQITLTTTLDLDPNSSSTDITAYPNSTLYPGNYELNMRVTAMVNTFQTGRFYLYGYKRMRTWNNSNQTWGTWGTWGGFTPNINIFPNLGPTQTPSSTYSGLAKTAQYEGTQIEYYVKVRFVALDGGEKTVNTPTRTATIKGVPTACFTMYNIESTAYEPSGFGPIPVHTICHNAVTINGSCSKFEQGYHIRISEFNLATWTATTDIYNNWIPGSTEAPAYISINAIAANNNYTLVAGKLYLVNISVGPIWHSAVAQFFRVDDGCRVSDIGSGVSNEIVLEEEVIQNIKLYPNPVKDELILTSNKDENFISYSIFDNSGTMVKKAEFSSKSKEQKLNLNDLKKGIYLINVETDKQSYREKIIKE